MTGYSLLGGTDILTVFNVVAGFSPRSPLLDRGTRAKARDYIEYGDLGIKQGIRFGAQRIRN